MGVGAVVALLAASGMIWGCPWDEENPYAKECRWMAGDADECWSLASSQGCVGRRYDPGSLACIGEECIDCDVTGASCTERCVDRGRGNYGYRETNKDRCIDAVADTPSRTGGWLGDVQCCCLYR